ncbi:Outer membrane receptor proteins, mostly Fe transport [hydrothermal vent metagenome]|uniref:Outer membrane receptor proteins, mostly Fe transport n=1 Tax=hydrothermal vent metagenome TaxID=652676 RepID=A0A3B0YFZ2_9ZZZZ
MLRRFLIRSTLLGVVSVPMLHAEVGELFKADNNDVMTIVITPQWQPVDPQDLPMTIDVLSAEELDASGLNNTLELQNKIPGFSFKTNVVLGQPYLRGVGSDIISAGSDASVATFIDGVYMTRAIRSVLDFYDLEHVDVMKGPQGVQLGRNVVGGAISIVSRDPVPFFESRADVTAGSFNRRQLRGMVNIPIKDTDFSLRLSTVLNRRDGYYENTFLGGNLDNEDYSAVRGKLRYHPSENTDVVLSIEAAKDDSTRGFGFQPDPVQGVNGGILNGGTVPGDPRKLTQNLAASGFVDTGLASLRVNRVFENTELISISAYQYSDVGIVIDLDGTEADFSTNRPTETSMAVSQEFRLLSRKNYPFGWLLGVYYLYEDADQSIDVRFPLDNVRNHVVSNVKTDAYAAFGQVSRYFTKRWRGIAGVRYNRDTRKLDLLRTIDDPGGALGSPGTTTQLQNEDKTWDSLTPELALEYTPDDDSLVYAKISRGYKSGGFNTSAVQAAFDPEDLRAFETGFKVTDRKRRINLNAALFYYDYRDIQLLVPPVNAPVGTLPVVINAAEATIKGIDVSTRIQTTDALELSLGATFLDAAFDKFVSIDPNNPAADPNRSGGPLPQAPDVSINLGSRYHWRTGIGKFTARLGYRYQSAVYFNSFKDRAVKEASYGLLDASIAFESRKGRWYAELFGKNLTDELYARSKIRDDPLVGVMRFWGDPRTIGLRVGFRL